ncbi:MAG: FIST C-terminal domain-containing protein [Deltaproteobacteria bacterium]|nr:FIST C-terminal domain-containing protein [Deltaproteobacteria bacterium]
MVARKALGQANPKLAIVFASVSYPDVAGAARAVRNVVGDVQIIGGTSGACVFATDGTAGRGVSVVLLGGDDIEVVGKSASCRSASLVETVPAAEEIARAAERAAARGFPHYACLAFAPGIFVDGEAFVAAVRKGAGAHAQLAGALTGDDLTMDRPKVLFGDELHDDRTVVTGIFTKSPVGVAARHGWRAVGPSRTVTRADGIHLVELDGRPALDVWLEDARNAGAEPPSQRAEVPLYLANRYSIGIADASQSKIRVADDERRELVARTPISLRDDGAFKMSASIAEGTTVRVMHASSAGMLRASGEAAAAAAARVGGTVSGALVLACAGRLACLGDAFSQEPLAIQRAIGAPIGGACVFGEVARNVRDVDAFFNTTAVVVAFGG